MKARPLAIGLALLLTLGVVAWVATSPVSAPQTPRSETPAHKQASAESKPTPRPASSEPSSSQRQASTPANRARSRADALRQQILARHAKAGPKANDGAEKENGSGTGGLTDRIGGRDDLLQALNADFLPLADECIQAAVERDPELQGMLGIGIEVIGDPELGAVIENVEFGERNEIDDARLQECVRETAYSTILPAPPDGGRDELLVTLRVNLDEN